MLLRGNNYFIICALACSAIFIFSCSEKKPKIAEDALTPVLITEQAQHDTDDPAIWIHPTDPAQSLIIGTDKNEDGALYVYNLQGKIIEEKIEFDELGFMMQLGMRLKPKEGEK